MADVKLTMVNKNTGEKFEFEHFFLVGNLMEDDSLLTIANLQHANMQDVARIAVGVSMLTKQVRVEIEKLFPGIRFSEN